MAPSEVARTAAARADGDPRTEQLPGRLDKERYHFLCADQAQRRRPELNAEARTQAALGAPAAIVRSIEDARLAFAEWGIETREAGRCAAP
jgi:hypothetical protein